MMQPSYNKALLLLSLLAAATADSSNPDPNSEFYKAPSTAIDFPRCFNDLANADKNGDGVLKKDEYLGFIQAYAADQKCIENPVLTFQQRLAFNQIACTCSSIPGAPADCCVRDNAEIITAGAQDPKRTGTQNAYLTSACRITDETLGPPQCPPTDADRETVPPPDQPVLITPPPPQAVTAASGGGFPEAALWGLIAAIAALLLLCCCCVCVIRRKRAQEEEEEQEEITLGKGFPGSIEEEEMTEPAPLGSSQDIECPPDIIPVFALPIDGDDESEDEDGGRKRRGGVHRWQWHRY